MIRVSPSIALDDDEIELSFVRASGPGGQNVNKVATAVQLRFNVAGSRSLPPEVKARLVRLAGRRITAEGVLVIDARSRRSQALNRADAIRRLVELVGAAAERPRPRVPTRASAAARARRREAKRRRAETKRTRRPVDANAD